MRPLDQLARHLDVTRHIVEGPAEMSHQSDEVAGGTVEVRVTAIEDRSGHRDGFESWGRVSLSGRGAMYSSH